MRKIQLTDFDPPKWSQFDNKGIYYCVRLGNGTVHTFTSKRAAQQFLVETSDFATQKMHEVNIYLGQFTFEYHRIWPYLFDPRADNNFLREIDTKIIYNLNDVRDGLKMLERNYVFSNMNTEAWRCLSICYKALVPTCQLFINFYKYRSQGAEAHQFEVHQNTLTKSFLEFKQYGRGRANVVTPGERYQLSALS